MAVAYMLCSINTTYYQERDWMTQGVVDTLKSAGQSAVKSENLPEQ